MTKIEPLPIFDGSEPAIWVSFEAVYRHLKSVGLQHDELIAEISTAVKGKARKFIQDLLVVRANPDTMLQTLRNQFGDSTRILLDIAYEIENHVPPRESRKEDLIDFALLLKSLVTTAKFFNKSNFLHQPFLIDKIEKMLRLKHQDEWWQNKRECSSLSIEDLAAFVMEKALLPSAQPRSDLKNRTEACVLCSNDHHISKCTDFLKMSPANRYSWVKSRNLCSCCLRPGHFWRHCPDREMCDQCPSTHHPLLHDDLRSRY